MIKSKVWNSNKWNPKYLKVIFYIYIAIVLKVIIFKYPFRDLVEIVSTWNRGVIRSGFETANFTLFKTIRMYINYSYMLNSFENLVGNIMVFVPFGFLLPHIKENGKKFYVLFLNAFIFILGIEVFQMFSAFGAFDVDDILLNCLGAILGWSVYIIRESILRSKEKRKDAAC